MTKGFKDRTDAGRQLAALLMHLRGKTPLVLGLPRGGLPVAYEVAHALQAPLDVLNVRKLGVPWHEELAMGAIAGGGVRVLNDDVIRSSGITSQVLEEATARQRVELDRRERVYRVAEPAPEMRGKTVVLVDDGIATGATVRAAIAVVRSQQPGHLVLAVPVAQDSIVKELGREVDDVVCVARPDDLYAIGLWYEEFPQLTDGEVQSILARATAETGEALTAGARSTGDLPVVAGTTAVKAAPGATM